MVVDGALIGRNTFKKILQVNHLKIDSPSTCFHNILKSIKVLMGKNHRPEKTFFVRKSIELINRCSIRPNAIKILQN